MKTLKLAAPAIGLSLILAACGDTDDASTEITPDTVEVPAENAMSGVEEEPVVDEEANTTAPPANTARQVEAESDNAAAAANVSARDAEDAAAAATEAAAAARAAAGLAEETGTAATDASEGAEEESAE